MNCVKYVIRLPGLQNYNYLEKRQTEDYRLIRSSFYEHGILLYFFFAFSSNKRIFTETVSDFLGRQRPDPSHK